MILKRKSPKGGYKFGRLTNSPDGALHEISIPEKITIPLRQGFCDEAPATVNIGDKVKAGQIIGKDDHSRSSPIHSSVDGFVKEIVAIKRLGINTNAVVIETDSSQNQEENKQAKLLPYDAKQLRTILYDCGVSSLGQYGFPTEYNASPLKPEEAKVLIINALNTEPYSLKNSILIDDISKFMSGISILRDSLDQKVDVYLAIERADKSIINQIMSMPEYDWLNICPLDAKYPQNHEIIITETILGKRIPYKLTILDLGVIIMDVQDVLHACEAVMYGKPVMERIVAIGGSGLNKGVFVKARIGTSIEHILSGLCKSTENRFIYGGVLTGTQCHDLSIPIDRATSSISVLEENRSRQFLFFLRSGINRGSFSNAFLSSLFPMVERNADTNMNGESRPCIYCNYCEEVCPVDLIPYLLNNYATHDMIDEAIDHRPLSCIDCNLCTYVCPSKIPLASKIKELKEKITEINE